MVTDVSANRHLHILDIYYNKSDKVASMFGTQRAKQPTWVKGKTKILSKCLHASTARCKMMNIQCVRTSGVGGKIPGEGVGWSLESSRDWETLQAGWQTDI